MWQCKVGSTGEPVVQGRAGFPCGMKYAFPEDASRLAVRMEQDAAQWFDGTPVDTEKQPLPEAAILHIAILADQFVARFERLAQ